MDELKPLEGPATSRDLDITGMHCAACVRRVERALLAVPGVTDASVNLASERVRVSFARAPDIAGAIAAVERAGYKAQARRDEGAAGPIGASQASAAGWDHELIRLGVGVVLTLPLLVGMAVPGFALPPSAQAILAAIVLSYAGAGFYAYAWTALRGGAATMDLLVALGTSAAFVLSLFDLFRGGPLYFEASSTVVTLVLAGRWLERRVRRRAGDALRALAALRPATARVLGLDGGETDVPVGQVVPGQRVVVRPGERIPVDGLIREGEGDVDEALLTGESRPVPKRPGERVIAGAVNGPARLVVETMAVGPDTWLAGIMRIVETAQASKAPIQRLVDRVSAVFVPLVILVATITFLGQWWWTGEAGHALIDAVSVLVIACPCAMGLAAPAAIMATTGAAARHGILIRRIEILEAARRIGTVAFDKTGTLTRGKPALLDMATVPDVDAMDALALAAGLQQGSEHPLAKAVMTAAAEKGVVPARIAGIRALPGRGIIGQRGLMLGNDRLMTEQGVDTTPLAQTVAGYRRDGHTVAWLVREGRALAVFAFGDPVRVGAVEAVARIKLQGLNVALLSGDHAASAEAVAREIGITQVSAELLPEEKVAAVERLRAPGGGVAMVGDGINDAAALTAADIGIAMGEGTDVAMASAPVTLARPDLKLVPAVLDIARRGRAKIVQGLFWAFAYNAVGIPLAALGYLSPMVAGAAMALSSVSVVANALILTRWKPEP
ncbi:MAG TPA: cation-translocating P-type ATPase [Stellaceae bacterium]|nr:cation-translocating P-type ATPase [Stellaceae bacterium]